MVGSTVYAWTLNPSPMLTPAPPMGGGQLGVVYAWTLNPNPRSNPAHQWVLGSPGAVDSQRCVVEPLKSTSNQQATPCTVVGTAPAAQAFWV